MEILPLLKDADWPGKADSLCRPLTTLALDDQPLVAFGYDQNDAFQLLPGQLSPPAAALERTALANLRQRSASWEPITVKMGWFRRLKVLACTDDFLAAERILDRDFLLEAHRLLRADLLAVGIPRRGVLLVTDGAQPEKKLRAFSLMVAQQFMGDESPPVTPVVYGVADGQVVGHLEGGIAGPLLRAWRNGGNDPGDEDDGDGGDDREDGGDSAPYLQSLRLTAHDGSVRMVLAAGGATPERLDPLVRAALAEIRAGREPHAMAVNVAIVADITPYTVELQRWMDRLQQDLPVLVGQPGRPTRDRLTVTYGQPD